MEVSRSPFQELQNVPKYEDSASQKAPNLSDEDRDKFQTLVSKAKQLSQNGDVKQALASYQRAMKIHPSEKLVKRVQKIKLYLEEYGSDSEEDSDTMVHLGDGFYLCKDLYDKLYSHQRISILWMWGLFRKRKGGILGDDMGLGKTIQVIGFLSGMFDSEKIKTVLLVLPVAVIINWTREFDKWAPGIRLENFHGGSKAYRQKALAKVQSRGGVVLTSYGMLVNNAEELAGKQGREYVWDYIILDEGHKIKNPSTKCSKGLQFVAAKHRLLLTGTPVMNKLKELWALYNWAHQGTLLGTARTFAMEYEQPITKSRQKDATVGEQRLGKQMAESLQKIISPYFMRRTKNDVAKKEGSDEADKSAPEMPTMTRKNDFVCWVYLSEIQQKIYEDFSHSQEVKDLLNTSRSPLTALVLLKKICDHPRLLTNRQCLHLGLKLDKDLEEADELTDEMASTCAATRIKHIADHILVEEAGKMVFLVHLLDRIRDEGHRCLVFSQSRKVLDIIQQVLTGRGHKVKRLDGTITKLQEREEIIESFARNTSYSVFLLTTQVGGVGLTLTAADRVVIFDPSWNPATDAQAVDRAFRIGQVKDVVVYRLITCGSVEEKIYRRQIFKDSINKQMTGDAKNPYRYFSKQDLHELFQLDNPRLSTTQQQLVQMHQGRRNTDCSLDEHIAFLHSLDMFGLSDHDLMFGHHTEEACEREEAKDFVEGGSACDGTDYIEDRVHKAQMMLTQESEENQQMTDEVGRFMPPEELKTSRPRPTTQYDYGERFPSHSSEEMNKTLEETLEELQLQEENERPGSNFVGKCKDVIKSTFGGLVQILSPASTPLTPKTEARVINLVSPRSPSPPSSASSDSNYSPHPFSSHSSGSESPVSDLKTSFKQCSEELKKVRKYSSDSPILDTKAQRFLHSGISKSEDSASKVKKMKVNSSFDELPSFTSMRDMIAKPDNSSDGGSTVFSPEKQSSIQHSPASAVSPQNSVIFDSPSLPVFEPSSSTPNNPHSFSSPAGQRTFMKSRRSVIRPNTSTHLAESSDEDADSSHDCTRGELEELEREAEEDMGDSNDSNASTESHPQNPSIDDNDDKLGISNLDVDQEVTEVATNEDGHHDSFNISMKGAENTTREMGGESEENGEEESTEEHHLHNLSRGHSESSSVQNMDVSQDEVVETDEDVDHQDSVDVSMQGTENATSEMSETDSDTTEEEEEEEELTEEQQAKYVSLMSRSRELFKSGLLSQALSYGLDAVEIYSGDERAMQYINRIQSKLV